MPSLAFALTLVALGQVDKETEALVARQQSSAGLLWAVEMDIDVYFSSVGKGPIDPPLHMYHEHWARDPQRERQHVRRLVEPLQNKYGQPIGISDLLDAGNSRRVVENWDYAVAGTKIPLGPNAVRARMLQRTRDVTTLFFNPVASFSLQSVQSQSFDVVRSVPEFLRESPRVTLGQASSSGVRELIALHPDEKNGGKCKGCVTHLFFDSNHGGLICRQMGTAPANEGATAPTMWETEVTKWSEPRPGLFVPMEVRGRTVAPKYDNGRDKLMHEARQVASQVRINEEVPESAFQMPFPEGAVVHDFTDPRKPQYHLWGADDKPIATADDIVMLPLPVPAKSDTVGYWRAWIAPAGFGTLLAVLLGIWYYRRRAAT